MRIEADKEKKDKGEKKKHRLFKEVEENDNDHENNYDGNKNDYDDEHDVFGGNDKMITIKK